MSYAYLFKYIVVGETSVGKSCLVMQFINGRFLTESQPTIGVDFGMRINKRPQLGVDNAVKLHIWDTGGMCVYRSLTRSYYRGAAGVLLVYDITSRETFNALNKWIEDVRTLAADRTVVTLVGNKCDLAHRRQVTFAEGEEFANKHGFSFFETSAKNAIRTEEPFFSMTDKIVEYIQQGTIDVNDPSNGVRTGALYLELQNPPPRSSSNCFQCKGQCLSL
jgi:small GTP-binding protein